MKKEVKSYTQGDKTKAKGFLNKFKLSIAKSSLVAVLGIGAGVGGYYAATSLMGNDKSESVSYEEEIKTIPEASSNNIEVKPTIESIMDTVIPDVSTNEVDVSANDNTIKRIDQDEDMITNKQEQRQFENSLEREVPSTIITGAPKTEINVTNPTIPQESYTDNKSYNDITNNLGKPAYEYTTNEHQVAPQTEISSSTTTTGGEQTGTTTQESTTTIVTPTEPVTNPTTGSTDTTVVYSNPNAGEGEVSSIVDEEEEEIVLPDLGGGVAAPTDTNSVAFNQNPDGSWDFSSFARDVEENMNKTV